MCKNKAERVGFEPTEPGKSSTVFKTASLNRSDTPPKHIHFNRYRFNCQLHARENENAKPIVLTYN